MRAKLIRQTYFAARLDLSNALRSRRAQAMLLLYVMVVLGSTYAFCRLLEAAQEAVGSAAPLTESLARSPGFRIFVTKLTGDAGVARRLITTPPMSLFFGWLSLTFLPFLVVVNSSDAVAAQVRTGEARFVIFRAGRLPFVLGTLASHALLMTLGLMLGAAGTLLVGSIMLGTDTFFADARAMASIGAGTWCYSFAYLGLALGVSQLVSSAAAARGLGLAAFLCLFLCSVVLRPGSWVADCLPEALRSVARWFFPQDHSLGLWRLTLAERLPPKAALVILGALYWLPGWLYFRRRDL
ncbi:MAG: hypothetical protein ACYSU0_10595 [Planctomycetota bacterium]|jgi:ABC-type transport system involved in multi-copper enzyme maturation permease subunit